MRCLLGVILLGLVALAPAAAAPAPEGFRIAITEWFTCATCTTMKGVVSGDVVGTFRGAVLDYRPAASSALFQTVHGRYVIRAARGSRSFTALVNGRQNRKTGVGVLDGLVTEGWEIGAQVHVELRPVACPQSESGCYRAAIRVR